MLSHETKVQFRSLAVYHLFHNTDTSSPFCLGKRGNIESKALKKKNTKKSYKIFGKRIKKKNFWKKILKKNCEKKIWKKNCEKKILEKNGGKKFWKKMLEKGFDKKNLGKINYKTKIDKFGFQYQTYISYIEDTHEILFGSANSFESYCVHIKRPCTYRQTDRRKFFLLVCLLRHTKHEHSSKGENFFFFHSCDYNTCSFYILRMWWESKKFSFQNLRRTTWINVYHIKRLWIKWYSPSTRVNYS